MGSNLDNNHYDNLTFHEDILLYNIGLQYVQRAS